jgi:ABC-type uncharacterized transport system involved in gliding motility auxiliary subunit
MRTTIERFAPFLPLVGLALLLSGLVVALFVRRFDTPSYVLLGVGLALLLLFIILRPDDVRRLLTIRQIRYGSSSLLAILMFAAIAILLYWVVSQFDNWRLDVTETNEFTPLAETVELLESLESPVHVIGFYPPSFAGAREEARVILDNLTAVSDNLTYEFQDPETNPILAEKYELTGSGSLVFIRGEGEAETFAKAATLSDRDIHSALLQIVNPTEKKLYFVTGHGERDIADSGATGLGTVRGNLEALGFTVEPLNLLVAATVPEDADAVFIVDPRGPMQPAEVDAVGNYLAAGGSLLLAREPVIDQTSAQADNDTLNAMLLDQWGVILERDLIIESAMALPGQDLPVSFVSIDFASSPIIPEDLQSFFLVFDIARSVSHQESAGVQVTELIQTSPSSWGETNLATFPPQPAEGEDNIGPVNVAITAEKSDVAARLVVFGDADFASNNVVSQSPGNGTVFTNAASWLARDEVALELTPRPVVDRSVVIPQEQLALMQYAAMCLGPIVMAIAGIFVWQSRRRRA